MLISTFGAIKYKLAEQVIRTFAAESANYRVSKDIDDLIEKYKTKDVTKVALPLTVSAIMLLKLPFLKYMVPKCLILLSTRQFRFTEAWDIPQKWLLKKDTVIRESTAYLKVPTKSTVCWLLILP